MLAGSLLRRGIWTQICATLSRRVTSSAVLLSMCAPLEQRHQALHLHAGDRTLSEIFLLFGVIHQVTTDHAILTRITQEVVEDFAADNVQYLELRTTPKVLVMLYSSPAT